MDCARPRAVGATLPSLRPPFKGRLVRCEDPNMNRRVAPEPTFGSAGMFSQATGILSGGILLAHEAILHFLASEEVQALDTPESKCDSAIRVQWVSIFTQGSTINGPDPETDDPR